MSMGQSVCRPACWRCQRYCCACTAPPVPTQPLQTGVGYYATTTGGIQAWVPLYGWDERH
jgi:hypothetical protein